MKAFDDDKEERSKKTKFRGLDIVLYRMDPLYQTLPFRKSLISKIKTGEKGKHQKVEN